jgi:DNA-binding CsgD family transcriptional regulator/tetratricopeptide (TPR) repeat protein
VPYADRIGVSRTTGVFLLANHAEALIALGLWDEAEALLSDAARQDPPGMLVLPWLRLRARVRMARGTDGAQAAVNRALGYLGRAFVSRENKLSLLDLRIKGAMFAGDRAAAVHATRAALAEPDFAGSPRYGWPLLVVAATALDRAADDGVTVADRDELRDRIRSIAASLPTRWPAETANAAQVAALLDGGVDSWRVAVEAWRADGQRYELALALFGRATAAAAAGERAAAAETLDEVTAIGRALGAAPLLAAVDTLTRRAGLRTGGHPAEDEILTAREREVLRLVAEGQSNSRIAERLFISPKTASVHVSRIIAKLEVTNRGEAAAVARRLGLLDD